MADSENITNAEDLPELPEISDDSLSLSDTDLDKLDLSDISDDGMEGFPSFLTDKKEDDADIVFDDANNPDLGLDDINIDEPAVQIPETPEEAEIELETETPGINLDDVAADTSNLPSDDWTEETESPVNPDEFLDTPLPESAIEEAGEWPDAETPLQEAEEEIAENSENKEEETAVQEVEIEETPVDEESILSEEPGEADLTPVAEEYSEIPEPEENADKTSEEPEEEIILETENDSSPEAEAEENYSDEEIARELGDEEVSVPEENAVQTEIPAPEMPIMQEEVSESRYPEHPTLSEKELNRFLKWYSGKSDNDYIEFSTEYESGEIEGTEECKALNVKVGNSYYGWNVKFDNGLTMSLRDVRDYQLYYGKLPDSGGIISFGELTLTFKNIERIVSYESPEYYSYGIAVYE